MESAQKYKIYLSPNVYCEDGRVCIKGICKEIRSLSFKDKLFIFEDTIKGWFFEPLSILAKAHEGDINFRTGFIILSSSIAYIELFGSLLEGYFAERNRNGYRRRNNNRDRYKRSSKRLFKKGFNYIFYFFKKSDNNNEIIVDGIYKSSNFCSNSEIPEDKRDEIDRIPERIYELIRNGLAHQIFFKGIDNGERVGVIYSYTHPYAFLIEKHGNEELIIINPKEFLASLKASLDAYLNSLKLCYSKKVLNQDNLLLKIIESSICQKLIENFEKLFPEFHGKFKVFCGGYQGQ